MHIKILLLLLLERHGAKSMGCSGGAELQMRGEQYFASPHLDARVLPIAIHERPDIYFSRSRHSKNRTDGHYCRVMLTADNLKQKFLAGGETSTEDLIYDPNHPSPFQSPVTTVASASPWVSCYTSQYISRKKKCGLKLQERGNNKLMYAENCIPFHRVLSPPIYEYCVCRCSNCPRSPWFVRSWPALFSKSRNNIFPLYSHPVHSLYARHFSPPLN